MKLTLEQQYMLSFLHSQYHTCWCSCDFKSQCISMHGIDPQSWNILSPALEELILAIPVSNILKTNMFLYNSPSPAGTKFPDWGSLKHSLLPLLKSLSALAAITLVKDTQHNRNTTVADSVQLNAYRWSFVGFGDRFSVISVVLTMKSPKVLAHPSFYEFRDIWRV